MTNLNAVVYWPIVESLTPEYATYIDYHEEVNNEVEEGDQMEADAFENPYAGFQGKHSLQQFYTGLGGAPQDR